MQEVGERLYSYYICSFFSYPPDILAAMKSFLIPPHTYEETGTTWSVADVVYICSPRHEDDTAARAVLSALSQMGSHGRLPGRLVGSSVVSESQRVNLIRDKQINDPEGFRISVRPGGADICASTPAGTFYGAQALAEYIEYHGRRLPCCEIEDAPDLRRRGFFLDCSSGQRTLFPKLATSDSSCSVACSTSLK